MAIKNVVTDYALLSDRADEIDIRKENGLVRETVLDLKATIKHNDYVALAAPQIGVNKRILCINFKGDIRTFCNPVITNLEGFTLNKETCPSIPGKRYIRFRNTSITVMYQDPLGKVNSVKLEGLAAMVMQYAIDILDGLLISDVGLEIGDEWEEASEDERSEVLAAYLESLDIQMKQMKKEVEADPDMKKISDAIDFMESVKRGETILDTGDNTETN